VAEGLVPSLLFGALGGLIGWALVEGFGPGPIDVLAVQQALRLGAGSLALSLATLGVATAVAARKMTAVEHSAASHRTGFPWEVALLVLAGIALYLIGRNGAIETGERSGGRVDILLVLFPLLGISGAALFILRIAFAYLHRARDITARSRISLFLAARRLASASRSVMLFVGAAAVSVGMLVYSTGLVSSVRATTFAKTHVFVGSDVSVVVSDEEAGNDLTVPHTIVTGFDAEITGTENDIDVQGIEPGSFARTAYWDDDFAERSLEALLTDLRVAETASLPVIAVGPEELDARSFTVMGHEIPFEVVATARTWPGTRKDTPMVVAEKEALESASDDAGFSLASTQLALWVKGPTDAVLRAMSAARVDTQTSVSARDAAESSALLSISWTFGLLRVLGIVAGLMSIVGILLYVAGRHRARLVSYLIGRRMGLRTAEHRASLLLELLVMLSASLLLGGSLGLVAVRVIYRSLDLLPTVPPEPLFRVPAIEVLAAAIAFTAAATVGSRWIQRSSDSARPGEVMRLAD
jgi:putative ABC transport system permease protein